MTEREKLIDICDTMTKMCRLQACEFCKYKLLKPYCVSEAIADAMLKSGVIVLPINIGDTVFRISEVIVPEYDVNDNLSYVMNTKVYESTLKRSDIAINGVYLTREEAEKYAELPGQVRDLHKIPLKEE